MIKNIRAIISFKTNLLITFAGCIFLFSNVSAQHWLTYGEVYDYEIGDFIVTYGYNRIADGGWHQNSSLRAEMGVLDKQWSVAGDTVYYYIERKIESRKWDLDGNMEVQNTHDTIMQSHTNLNSVIVEYLHGWYNYLEKFVEVNGFHGRVVNRLVKANSFDATVYDFAEGLGQCRHIITTYTSHYQNEIIYYKKGNEEWGSYTPISFGEQSLKDITALVFQIPALNDNHIWIEDNNTNMVVTVQPNAKPIVSNHSDTSCIPIGIIFSTQNQIDNFQSDYPGCNEIEGNVTIKGSSITNLNGLNVLTSIGGKLSIYNNNALTSLSGMESLTSIGGGLYIYENNALTSLTGFDNLSAIGGNSSILNNNVLTSLAGLESLTSIEGDLSIYSNKTLNSLSVLENLTSIGGNLRIYYNDSLTSLSGLEGLTSIGGYLWIFYNNALTNMSGLDNLTSVGGYLWINANPALISLSGLENLDSIGGNFRLFSNTSLTNMSGLESLASIGGYLWIKDNAALTSLNGLGNLNSIGEHLWLFDNDALIALNGLESLASIDKNLWLMKNDSLTNLNGLDNLAFIGGDLWINHNNTLDSLTGLENLEAASINKLKILNNSSLSNCDAQWLCDYLAAPIGEVEIYGNASGCSLIEIAAACEGLPCLPHGNYGFYSQSDINLFKTAFPNCTVLQGDVSINGADITELSGLNAVTSIGGVLTISTNHTLNSLNGLENLISTGGLYVHNNNLFDNLTGLNNLAIIDGSLSVAENATMNNLQGMEGLLSIEGNIDISYNTALNTLNGLNNLSYVGGNTDIYKNESLSNLTGIENLTFIGGSLKLYYNKAMTNLSGLDNLNLVGGNLDIGMYNSGNAALTNLNGLESLTSIGGRLSVTSNPTLTSLNGLANLTSVGGGIRIINNHVLNSLAGLEKLESASITELVMRYNDSLSTCEVQSICDHLKTPNANVEINYNAPGCNSRQEVEEACEKLDVDEMSRETSFTIFPNPATSKIYIKTKNELKIETITIYNQLGQKVLYKTDIKDDIDVSSIGEGIFICELTSNEIIIRQKLIIKK